MRGGFLLDPDVAYLNHGSFGACAAPVFEEYQRLQLELEREPTDFLGRRFAEGMRAARSALATFVGRTDDLVVVPNATSGLNAVLRSLAVRSDDPAALWNRLYDEFRVEAPVYEWEGRAVLRVSIGPYTDENDIERLVKALRALHVHG